ncbi:MAG: 2-keto-4-pentenoate hydratase [Chloroflexota bacterium]
MPLSEEQRAEAAHKLLEAERTRQGMDPLTQLYPSIAVADSYDIQLRVIAAKKAAGATVIGKKIGLTAKVMQRMLGIDTPDYGHLMNTMRLVDGAILSCDEMLIPRVEVELAFVLDKPLRGPGVNLAQVLAATRYVTPAFEIIDSRVRDWKIHFEDTVADNGSSARFVLGSRHKTVDQVNLRLIGMVLEKNGEDLATGAGAAVLGNPAIAVAWLANALSDYGIGLEADEVILPGSLCAAFNAEAGDTFTAAFDGLGSVSVNFAS